MREDGLVEIEVELLGLEGDVELAGKCEYCVGSARVVVDAVAKRAAVL